MKIVSWNIMGLGKKEASNYLWTVVNLQKVDIILIQETHFEKEDADLFLQRISRNWEGTSTESFGKAGGIMVMWRKETIRGNMIYKDNQFITCIFEIDKGNVFLLTCVYASNCIRRRNKLWNMLSEANDTNMPWLLAGDMNCILKKEEKRGGRPFVMNQAVADFSNFINNAGLLDARFNGPIYTWTNKRKGEKKICARLDRVLFGTKWLEWGYDFKVEHMGMMNSDHRLLLIKSSCENFKNKSKKNRSFICEQFWFEYPEFKEVVGKYWLEKDGNSKSMMENISNLRTILSKWNRDSVGNLEKRWEESSKKLKELEVLEESGEMTEEGQMVNVEKSELLFPPKVDKGIKQKICSLFGIKEGRLISQAGKSVLLNSVVCSIPVYSMMAVGIKEKTVKEITKVSREFFWGSEGKKKANLIKWKTVSASKGLGGLGIRDLSLMRKAILAGRILPILNKEGNVWSSLYNAKYEMSKKKHVVELMDGNEWNMAVIEACFDKNLIDAIRRTEVDREETKDTWVWNESIEGNLSVKRAYLFLKQKEKEAEGPDFNWRKLWNVKVAEKITLFIWKLSREALREGFSIKRGSNSNEKEMTIKEGDSYLCADASWKEGLKMGYGFILVKDKMGIMQGSGMQVAENPLHAELKAIWYDLDNVRKKSFQCIHVCSDCEMAVKMLKGEVRTPRQLKPLVKKMRKLALSVKVIDWNFIRKNRNEEANILAREAICNEDMGEDVVELCNFKSNISLFRHSNFNSDFVCTK
ncbi:hypothetical protein Cni_G22022 [Canna indica]|uniref:Reverse transcriptase n=1 Tax=Canna indica TaxID=4628 RepID=A0AAQ3KUD6_9LILI|nr:hypothetical protein Cni_G22022 [Canna indica]